MNQLQALLQGHFDRTGESLRAAAERVNGVPSHATLSRLLKGERRAAEEKTLRGIALITALPYADVVAAYEAARTEDDISAIYAKLNVDNRAHARAVLDGLLLRQRVSEV